MHCGRSLREGVGKQGENGNICNNVKINKKRQFSKTHSPSGWNMTPSDNIGQADSEGKANQWGDLAKRMANETFPSSPSLSIPFPTAKQRGRLREQARGNQPHQEAQRASLSL